MLLHWSYFIILTLLMYICIALVGRFTGGESTTAWASVKALVSPMVLALIFVANVVYAIGIYYGFIVTENALPISISMGVIATFVYSLLFLGGTLTLVKLLGVACIVAGIFLLK